MNPADLPRLLASPVLFNLVVIFVLWLYYSSRRTWSAEPERRGNLYRCEACGRVFEGDRRQPRAACPDCGRFNDAVSR